MNLLKELRANAEAQVASFPQYGNHFADTTLARAKRTVKTRLGTAMVKGEIVLLFPRSTGDFSIIWSMRNKCGTSIRKRDLEPVPGVA
jgi:hypothetical protein